VPAAPPFTPATDILKQWPGSWACLSTGSHQQGPMRYSVVATTYGRWLQFSASLPATNGRPPSRFVNLTSYDSKAKQWFIVSYDTKGRFLISHGSAAPNATRQTWNDAYPVDPAREPGTIVMGATTFDAYNTFKDHGKRVTFHTACKKLT
jgi:hypothetical protein